MNDAVVYENAFSPFAPFVPLVPAAPCGPGTFTTIGSESQGWQQPDEEISCDGIFFLSQNLKSNDN
jgi:hypothetical protein